MIIDELKDRIARAEEIQRYTENRCDTLEKENTELKRRLDNLFNSDCWASEKLTKAKEHIRTLISCLIDWVQEGDKDYCHIADAEQFLKGEQRDKWVNPVTTTNDPFVR